MSLKTKILNWEQTHSAQNVPPTDSSPEAQSYRARMVESDARKAVALNHAFPEMEPLQKIRAFLRAGQLVDAAALIAEMNATELSPLDRAEVLLECARLSNAQGEWNQTVEFCKQALALNPPGITHMTLRQVSGVARYEMGDFAQARVELSAGLSLAKLYPHGAIALYTEATYIKVLTQDGDLREARARLKHCWENLRDDHGTIDSCTVLLRIETEVRRKERRPVAPIAYLTWLLARAEGDELFAALATVDLHFASSSDLWRERLDEAVRTFARVQDLVEQVRGTPRATSARTIKNSQIETLPITPQLAERVLLLDSGIFIDLKTLKISAVQISKLFRIALTALAHGPISKEDFFRAVWQQKFVAELHDQVIRRLLYRLRTECGIDVVSESRMLSLTGLVVADV